MKDACVKANAWLKRIVTNDVAGVSLECAIGACIMGFFAAPMLTIGAISFMVLAHLYVEGYDALKNPDTAYRAFLACCAITLVACLFGV